MCGIFGFIGKSANPKISFELANALMLKTEIRGDHATGFWACERDNGRIFYDKEPVKSSIYATRDIWAQEFASTDSDILIGHCRLTSANVGHERYNKNNHPHVSADRRIALVHNGKIAEYNILKSRYDLKSDCDSEILLSMFETGDAYKGEEELLKKEFANIPLNIAHRMMGVKEIFSRVNYGAMAVAIAERSENTTGRTLWLFRDDERPLHVIDMRKTLGQIFFCSTAEIWRSSVESCPSAKPYVPDEFLEVPSLQVWMINMEPNEDPDKTATDLLLKKYESEGDIPDEEWRSAVIENQDVWITKKFKITKTRFYDYEPNKEENKKVSRIKGEHVSSVVTRLNTTDEELIKSENFPIVQKKNEVVKYAKELADTSYLRHTDHLKHTDWDDMESDVDLKARDAASSKDPAYSNLTEFKEPEIDMEKFSKLVQELKQAVENLSTTVTNMHQEGSLNPRDYETVAQTVKETTAEIKGSMIFLK